MVQIIWSERAIQDLDNIAEYVAVDSELAAKKFIQALIKKAQILLSFPEIGRLIPENIPGGYRQIIYKSYRIIYKIKRNTIIIFSVYHQKRLLITITDI